MAFQLSDDETLIQKTMAEFARDHIGLEKAEDMDRHDRFPQDVLQAAAGLGLLGMALPAEAGGAGVGPTGYALAVMEVARVCPNTAAVLAVHNGLGCRLLLEGPDALRAAAASGEVVASLATEEAHGSDHARLGTVAEPEGDGFRITGMKVWGTAAAGASHLLVLADAPDGPTWFHVAADAPGVHLGRNEALLGLRASGIRTVHLSDVEVGSDAVVGGPGEGRQMLGQAMPWLQVGAAAALVGAVQGADEAARRFAADRVQFGKPIGTYQAVSDTVGHVDVHAAAARALTLEAAAHLEAEDAPLWAARAKLYAAEMAVPATRRAIRIQGGTGFMREGGTERFARDVRALQFLGEPPVMQQDAIKRRVLDIEFEAAP